MGWGGSCLVRIGFVVRVGSITGIEDVSTATLEVSITGSITGIEEVSIAVSTAFVEVSIIVSITGIEASINVSTALVERVSIQPVDVSIKVSIKTLEVSIFGLRSEAGIVAQFGVSSQHPRQAGPRIVVRLAGLTR